MNLKWPESDKNKVAPVIMSHKSCLFNFLIVSWDIAMEMKIQRSIHRANTKWLISLVSWGNKTKLETPVTFNFLGLLPLTVTKKKKKRESSCNWGKHVGCLANSIDQRLWIQFNHSDLWNIQAKMCVWLSLLSHHSWALSSQKSSNKARKTFMIRPPTSLGPSPTAQGPSLTIMFGQ